MKMAKRHCYPISTALSHSNSGQIDSSFPLDSLYCFEERCEEEDIDDGRYRHKNINSPNTVILSEHDFVCEDEELVSLFSKEQKNKLHNSLQNNPLLLTARRKAVEWILKVNEHYSFTALTAVLAVDYVDRFLSSIHFQLEKPWMTHLTAVACISLAAKVEETRVPLLLDIQVEENEYFFEAKTIKRMEILVLSTLEWRMNPVNPISFLDYIVRRVGFKDQLCSEFLGRCERLLLSVISDSRFVCFLPSVTASAIMLQVINDIEPSVAAKYQDQLLCFLQIDKDKVNDCCKFITEESSRGQGNKWKGRRFETIPRSKSGRKELSSSTEQVRKKIKVEEQPLQDAKLHDRTGQLKNFSGVLDYDLSSSFN